MNINELNDDCLIYIFEQLYGGDFSILIRQRLICKRWRDIIEHNILNRKKTLKLFRYADDVHKYYEKIAYENAIETDCFKINPNFSGRLDITISGDLHSTEKENFLIRVFPLLEELIVYQQGYLSFHLLHPFLIQTNHLTSLTLCGDVEDSAIVPKLLDVIYGLSHLKELNILNEALTKLLTQEGMCRICPQLSQLSLTIGKFKPFFLGSLTSNCTYLRLDIAGDLVNIFHSLIENDLSHLNRLSKLRIATYNNHYRTKFLYVICEKFHNLEYLDFSHYEMHSYYYLCNGKKKWTFDHNSINNLKKLANLTELRLSHVLFKNPDGQLPTIERLHLSNMGKLKLTESLPKISRIFPNITELNSRRINWSMLKKSRTNYGSDNDYNDFYDSDNEYF